MELEIIMNLRVQGKFGLTALLFATTPLFFVDIISDYLGAATSSLWNLGHILFFALATLNFLSYSFSRTVRGQLVFVGLIVFLSIVIEFIQHLVGRSASIVDVARNMAGVLIGFSIVYRKQIPFIIVVFVLLLPTYDGYRFVKSVQLQLLVQSRSPLIENFESIGTYKFWTKPSAIVSNDEIQSNTVLMFNATAGEGLRIYMSPTLKDWSSFSSIEFFVFNKANEERNLTFHANDKLHDRGGHHGLDIFRKVVSLTPGENRVTIPLSEIEQPPNQRKIHLDQMLRIGFVFDAAEEGVDFLIDDIKLIRQ